MAQCKLTPHEFIQNAFSPMVAVMCSQSAEQICQKNNLSFVEMIQPFCRLSTEAYIRDPSGATVPVRNLRITMADINSHPPQPTLARKFLNESVNMLSSDRNTSLQIGSQSIDIPVSVPWFEAWRDTFLQVQFPSDHEFTKHYIACVFVVSSSEKNQADVLQQMGQQLQQMQSMTPAKLPKWFCPNVLRYYVLLHDAVDADLGTAEAAFNTVKTAYSAANSYFLQVNSRQPGQNSEDQSHLPDPWSQFLFRIIDPQELSQTSSPRTPADVVGVSGMPSRLTTEGSCDLEPGGGEVRPVGLEVGQEAASSVAVTLHPLSPDADSAPHAHFNNNNSSGAAGAGAAIHDGGVHRAPNHINANVWAGLAAAVSPSVEHGLCLTTADLDGLRNLVQEFATKALLPYIEKQIQQLSDMISNKKGVSRSLFSATKRWFGSNKPGLPGSNTPVNAVIYSTDAPELQLRRLGDLCFMFGLHALAFQAYHSAKRDFSADQAWLYYAGALEMAALSAFMHGEPTRKAQEYMDESIVTYLNSCKMPQFATRATLLSAECLKGRQLHGEAAKQLIRMTSEDSDLRSALLLEQASYCFLRASRPTMVRKYAFHVVLAGHRFSKAGQRKHALRCYRQAHQVYANKSWSLAEDHIHFTIGRLAANLSQVSDAATAFSHLLSVSSRQSTVQQAAFLREFLATQKQLQEDDSGGDDHTPLPLLPLPLARSEHLRVLLGPLPPPPLGGEVPATGVGFWDPPGAGADGGAAWTRLEEMLVADAQGSLPMIFKPTVQLLSNKTANTSRPVGVVGEPVTVCLTLENPLHIPLPLLDVRLLWSFTPAAAPHALLSNEADAGTAEVETQHLDSLLLKPDWAQEVVLSVTPKSAGDLQVLGVAYRLTSPPADPPAAGGNPPAAGGAPPASVPGKQVFSMKPQRPKTTNERVGQDSQDRRLEVNITDPAPRLQVTFVGLTSTMLSGELQPVTIQLLNAGRSGLRALHVGWSRADLLSMPGQGGPGGPPSRSAAHRGGGSEATRVALPGDRLAPAQAHEVPVWLRAPDTPGPITLDMLFYYENVKTNCIPRYRLVRHSWTILVLPSVQVHVSATRSNAAGRHGNAAPGSRGNPVAGDHDDEVLNVMACVKNDNQGQDSVVTEVTVVQLALASPVWRLAQQVVVQQDVRLQSQETVHLMAQAHRSITATSDGSSVFSSIQTDRREVLPPVDSSPYADFLSRRPEQLASWAHHAPQADNGGDADVKEVRPALGIEATLVVRWKASVTDSDGHCRSAIGQHHIAVDRVGPPAPAASCPPPSPPVPAGPGLAPAPPEQPGTTLKIFGPDAVPCAHNSTTVRERYTPLDAMQKLVTYTMRHAPSVGHDFAQNRICIVPVRLVLQNCSDSHLVVRVNTLGNNSASSNKNQLYSPHSSGAFRWVCLAGACVEVAPHRPAHVCLSAALAGPGTYDLGARLEVTCRLPPAPEADTVTQTWRIESSLVVANTPATQA